MGQNGNQGNQEGWNQIQEHKMGKYMTVQGRLKVSKEPHVFWHLRVLGHDPPAAAFRFRYSLALSSSHLSWQTIFLALHMARSISSHDGSPGEGGRPRKLLQSRGWMVWARCTWMAGLGLQLCRLSEAGSRHWCKDPAPPNDLSSMCHPIITIMTDQWIPSHWVDARRCIQLGCIMV